MSKSIEVIKKIINPILIDANIKKAYLFGSYARGDQHEGSDVDLLIDCENSEMTMFDLSNLKFRISDTLEMPVDLVTTGGLRGDYFSYMVNRDKVQILGSEQ